MPRKTSREDSNLSTMPLIRQLQGEWGKESDFESTENILLR
jgi:hypothetical protein